MRSLTSGDSEEARLRPGSRSMPTRTVCLGSIPAGDAHRISTTLWVINMDWRNRLGLYGGYFCAMAGIGFTLPYLPLYLKERGLSDRDIGIISTLAALGAL